MANFPNPYQDKKDQFFGSTPVILSSGEKELVVDVLIEERPDFSFKITEHPVEEGLSINDAKFRKPVTLTLECIFMDMDLSPTGVARNAMYGGFSTEDRKNKRDRLFLMAEEDGIIEVVTPYRTYKSMVIESIVPEITARTASADFVTLTLREVVRVESAVGVATKEVPKRLKSKEKEANKNAEKKEKPPKDKAGKGTKTPKVQDNTAYYDAASRLLGWN